MDGAGCLKGKVDVRRERHWQAATGPRRHVHMNMNMNFIVQPVDSRAALTSELASPSSTKPAMRTQ